MILDDLATTLAGTLGAVGAALFKGELPATPDDCSALFEYPGLSGVHAMGGAPGARAEQPRIQVLVRSGSYQTGRATIEAAYQAIDGLGDQVIGGVAYHRLEAIQAPFFLEVDAEGRYKFAFNLAVIKALS